MRALALILSVLLASFPAMQAYGKTMAETHCSTRGHVSKLAPDAAHDPLHAQHHAPETSAQQYDVANTADAKAESAHCQCGCLCNVACAGGVALSASIGFSAAAPSHEPWQAVADPRRPVTVHEFLLRPPRSLLS